MGGGQSTTKLKPNNLEEEFHKPLDGSDIDTPRGESAKAEVRRLRKLLAEHKEIENLVAKAIFGDAPSLDKYLEKTFKKNDVDASGTLNVEEFTKMVKDLKLGLSEEDIVKLQALVDVDTDGNISVEEFVKAAPTLMKSIYKDKEDNVDDWIVLESSDGYHYYFNKRTGETQWAAPGSYRNHIEEIANGVEEALAPSLQEYLTRIFREADSNESGKLSNEEFWALVQTELQLGLTDDQYQKLLSKLDVNEDSEIEWNEFVIHAPGIIQGLQKDNDTAACWVKAVKAGETFYMNTKTGETSWDEPEGYSPVVDKSAPAPEDSSGTAETESPAEDSPAA